MACVHPRQTLSATGTAMPCAWPGCDDGAKPNVLEAVVANREETWRRVRVNNDWFWVRAFARGGVWDSAGHLNVEVPIT